MALRFLDPLDREDTASRVIPHEFVVTGSLADEIESLEDGRRVVWHLPGVADKFVQIWNSPELPTAHGRVVVGTKGALGMFRAPFALGATAGRGGMR